MSEHLFPYEWKLSEANFTKDKGTVFSCFACGGGSTMGYKLAGFDVLGCNEIDPKMMEAYWVNHSPKYSYLEPIQTFKKREDLPQELFELDILDGSPPCSSFSMAGNREKDWGKEKKFREGQAKQRLDNLFFDFIDLAKRLQPKVVIAENVKGLLLGNAKDYVRRIYAALEDVGYYVQHFLLDASKMGVPQRRERVFFIALRKDLATPFLIQQGLFDLKPYLQLEFREKQIPFKFIHDGEGRAFSSPVIKKLWDNRMPNDNHQGDANMRLYGKGSNFNQSYAHKEKVLPTIASKESCMINYDTPTYLSKNEKCKAGTFPLDYHFKEVSPHYLIGMSVPPVMTAQIATRIYEQWLSKIPK